MNLYKIIYRRNNYDWRDYEFTVVAATFMRAAEAGLRKACNTYRGATLRKVEFDSEIGVVVK